MQVRQLQALGFTMRQEVVAEVETASRFYRYGLALKQCAQFFNNVASHMIPCQKPLMLEDALEFEQARRGRMWLCCQGCCQGQKGDLCSW